MSADMTPDRDPTPPFDTNSHDTTFVEFTATIDGWEPISTEWLAELRRRLPPPWGTKDLPPEPQPPTE